MAAPVKKKTTQSRRTASRGYVKKPDYERELSTLFQILGNENQILMRTDQKAFTLLSILGVFMVFFIVHFLKVQMTWFIFLFVMVYFVAALVSIINLILVIVPRVHTEKTQEEESNPLFFAGISQYKSAGGYARHLRSIAQDREQTTNLFAKQVYSLGMITARIPSALIRTTSPVPRLWSPRVDSPRGTPSRFHAAPCRWTPPQGLRAKTENS